MTDLQAHLTEAAATAIMADPRKVRLVAIELELVGGRRVAGGTVRIERRMNMGKLLGGGRRWRDCG